MVATLWSGFLFFQKVAASLNIYFMIKVIKQARKAGPGTYTTIEYARKHPKTTVVETRKIGKK